MNYTNFDYEHICRVRDQRRTKEFKFGEFLEALGLMLFFVDLYIIANLFV